MKKTAFSLLLMLASFLAIAQETPPTVLKAVNGQFYIHLSDSTIWQYKGRAQDGTDMGYHRVGKYKEILAMGATKQNTLVPGTNIKNINGASIVAGGDLSLLTPTGNGSGLTGLTQSQIAGLTAALAAKANTSDLALKLDITNGTAVNPTADKLTLTTPPSFVSNSLQLGIGSDPLKLGLGFYGGYGTKKVTFYNSGNSVDSYLKVPNILDGELVTDNSLTNFTGKTHNQLWVRTPTSPTAISSTTLDNNLITGMNEDVLSNGFVYSVELISFTPDRDFSAAGNWTGAGWTRTGGAFVHTPGTTTPATLPNANLYGGSIKAGKKYVIKLTGTRPTAGSITASLGGIIALMVNISSGDYTATLTAVDNSDLTITPASTFDGSFTNISIKEVLPQFNVLNDGGLTINTNEPFLLGSRNTDILKIARSNYGTNTITTTAGGTIVTVNGILPSASRGALQMFNVGDIIYANGEAHTVTAVGAINPILTTDAWTSAYTGSYKIAANDILSISKSGQINNTPKNQIIGLNIGTTNVNHAIDINGSNTDYANSGAVAGVFSRLNHALTIADKNTPVYGLWGQTQINTNNTKNWTAALSAGGVMGTGGEVDVFGTGTVSNAHSMYAWFNNGSATSTVTNATLFMGAWFTNSGAITNGMGLALPNILGTNNTSIKTGGASAPSGIWDLYLGSNKNNYMGGANTLFNTTTDNGVDKIQNNGTAIGNAWKTTGGASTDVTNGDGTLTPKASLSAGKWNGEDITTVGKGAGDIMQYDGTKWVNATVSATLPLQKSGAGAGGTWSIVKADATHDGYLAQADFNAVDRLVAKADSVGATGIGTRITYTVPSDGLYYAKTPIQYNVGSVGRARQNIGFTERSGVASVLIGTTATTPTTVPTFASYTQSAVGQAFYAKAGTNITIYIDLQTAGAVNYDYHFRLYKAAE